MGECGGDLSEGWASGTPSTCRENGSVQQLSGATGRRTLGQHSWKKTPGPHVVRQAAPRQREVQLGTSWPHVAWLGPCRVWQETLGPRMARWATLGPHKSQ
ncbi:hypothetical protein GUJ93_ZPchr0015g6977 [Zizania palustris]|uniref:Uncharacterized protein n=1 Tax=Zizania palustris TaxID=103762 RepID=A0A8J5SYJ2_ZIZPA|nr:hypothetical protein GUJ93_ZPchr0015g6977 [Zizania palustris]